MNDLVGTLIKVFAELFITDGEIPSLGGVIAETPASNLLPLRRGWDVELIGGSRNEEVIVEEGLLSRVARLDNLLVQCGRSILHVVSVVVGLEVLTTIIVGNVDVVLDDFNAVPAVRQRIPFVGDLDLAAGSIGNNWHVFNARAKWSTRNVLDVSVSQEGTKRDVEESIAPVLVAIRLLILVPFKGSAVSRNLRIVDTKTVTNVISKVRILQVVCADVGVVFEVGAETVVGEAAHDRVEFTSRSQIEVGHVGRIVVQDLKSSIIFNVEFLVPNLFTKVGDGRVVEEGVVLWHQNTSRRSNVVTDTVQSIGAHRHFLILAVSLTVVVERTSAVEVPLVEISRFVVDSRKRTKEGKHQ